MTDLLETKEGHFGVYHSSQAEEPGRHPEVGWYYEPLGVADGPDDFSPCFGSAEAAMIAAQLHERLHIGCNDVVMCSHEGCWAVAEVEKMIRAGWQVTNDGDRNLCPGHRES